MSCVFGKHRCLAISQLSFPSVNRSISFTDVEIWAYGSKAALLAVFFHKNILF
jgi:hypothetical protein